MKALIVYYSRRGENLVNGDIRTLRVGNTEMAAMILREDHEGGIVSNRPRAGLSERILSLHRPCKAGSAAQGTAGTKAMRYRQSMHWMEMPISGIKMLM
ncbi:MAG: hypothetical protein ACLUAR_00460 [Pilosibacter sp.]